MALSEKTLKIELENELGGLLENQAKINACKASKTKRCSKLQLSILERSQRLKNHFLYKK